MINKKITLRTLELFLLDLPQKTVFKSGIGIRKSKETLIVKWTDREGRIGYGECSCRPDPYYSAEFLEASMLLVQKFIAPKLKQEQTYGEVLAILRQVRGWGFTKSAVESAMFQIIKQTDTDFDLSKYIKTTPIEEVPVGISLGIYDDPKQFKDIVEEAIADGYQRVKFKISPYINIKNFEGINPLLFDNNVRVSFDANGSYQTADLEKMRYFVETYDAYIEQPTPPNRFDTCLRAKELFPDIKICFDEEAKNLGDLMKLHSLNMLDEVNLKIGRVGGITNSIEIINYCFENNIRCWIGGMFETGIGRLQNLELARFLPKASAHDLSPSSRYFKEDIISPDIRMDRGFINIKKASEGEIQPDRIEKYTTKKVKVSYQ